MLTTSRLIRPAASAVASATARSVRFQATAAAAVGTQKKKNVLLSSKDSAAQLSYARGLFFGEVNAYQAFPYPDTLDDETRETIKALVEPVDKFFREKVNSAEIDKTSTIPKEVLDGLKEMGLFGLQIPTELDGLGLSNTAYARVVERVCWDGSIAVTLLAHQSIGLKGILLNGNDFQKKKYLPKLATGEHIAAFALTEPTTGSDASSVRTKATLTPDGKHFLLNGSKIFISNGGWAQIYTVFAKAEVDGQEKMTAFIVDKAFGGISTGKPESKLGIKGSNTVQVFFENTKVPIENVLGEVGQGFKVAMNILNNGRFGLGAGSGAMIKELVGLASEYATSRIQFGKPLSEFGLIKEKFAHMVLDGYAIESMAYMTTNMIDRKDPDCYLEAAMCKVYGSEASWKCVNECIQVLGGMGFMTEQPYERMMRDCRILSIFEGTNEILRLMIALQGVRAVGDRLKTLGKNATNINTIWGEATERLSKTFNPLQIDYVPAELQTHVHQLGSQTAAFGSVVESLLSAHGNSIIDKQTLLKRVADVAIELFACSAVLSRASRTVIEKRSTTAHEVKIVQSYFNRAEGRINQWLKEIKQGEETNGDNQLASIADDIFKTKKWIPAHPIGV